MHKLEKQLVKICQTFLDIDDQENTMFDYIYISYNKFYKQPIELKAKIVTTNVYNIINKLLNVDETKNKTIKISISIKKIYEYETKKEVNISITGYNRNIIDKLVETVLNKAVPKYCYLFITSRLGVYDFTINNMNNINNLVKEVTRIVLETCIKHVRQIECIDINNATDIDRIIITISAKNKDEITNEIIEQLKNINNIDIEVDKKLLDNTIVINY